MFLYTWSIELSNSGILPFQVPFPIYITLGWGFIFVSLVMTRLSLGKDAIVVLLKRYVQWRVGWKWFLAALFLEPVFVLAGIYINAALTQTAPDFSSVIAYELIGESANLPLFVLPFFLVEILINGEEIGWRGYVLPRLQAKYNALVSTLILGVVWGFWHLPKFLSHFDMVAFAWFMLHIMSFAIILTWLYNNTKGSLLMVAICHAVSNTTSVFMPMANTASNENIGSYIIYVLLEVVVALIVTVYAGPAQLSLTESKQVQE
jgi:membrane protease YdiL (CAAX protease family)